MTSAEKRTPHICIHGQVPSLCPDCLAMQQPFPKAEVSEKAQAEIEFEAEIAILERAEKINEGKNAFITHVDIRDFSPEVREFLFGKQEVPDNQAVKLLKIYKFGEAETEMRAQMLAREILLKEADPTLPQVPKAYFGGDLNIRSEEGQNAMKRLNLGDKEKVGIIMMDLIDGVDIAQMMDIHILENSLRDTYALAMDNAARFEKDPEKRRKREHNAQSTLDDGLRLMKLSTPEQLKYDAQALAGYVSDKHKKQDDVEATQTENLKTLERALEKRNALSGRKPFTLPTGTAQSIKRALATLHEADVYHRDLHLRNIMVGNDRSTTYIIDFGTALIPKPDGTRHERDIWTHDNGLPFIKDTDVTYYLEKWEPKLIDESRFNEREESVFHDLTITLGRFKEHPEVRERWATLLTAIDESQNVDELRKHVEAFLDTFNAGDPEIREKREAIAILAALKQAPTLATEYLEERRGATSALADLKNMIKKNA